MYIMFTYNYNFNSKCVLKQDEFKRVINTLEDAILATDLAVYFQRRGETFSKMQSRSLEVNNLSSHTSADRSLFRGLLMTACDLGAITKPWPIQKKVTNNGISKSSSNVADEFISYLL